MKYSFSPEEALDAIFEQMAKQGLVTQEMENNKKGILDNVLNSFGAGETFSLDELKNEKIQKSLIGLIISETLGLKQNSKEFLNTLKSEKEDPTDKPNLELDKKVKHGLLLLAIFNQLDKSPQPKPAGQDLLQELEEKLKEKLEDGDKKEKTAAEVNECEKQIGETLRNLYGGDDPRISGEIPSVILGPIVGNLYGFTCQGPADSNSTALMIEQITYNPSKPDPLGLENIAKNIDEALGAMPGEVVADLNRPKLTQK